MKLVARSCKVSHVSKHSKLSGRPLRSECPETPKAFSSKVRQCCDGCGDSGLDQRDAILPPKSRGLGTIRWQDESCNNECPIAIARVPGNVVM